MPSLRDHIEFLSASEALEKCFTGVNSLIVDSIVDAIMHREDPAVSAVVEHGYVDIEYSSSYYLQIGRSFTPTERYTKRVIFFSSLITRKHLYSASTDLINEWSKSCLGYSVIRPSQPPTLGRTFIKPPQRIDNAAAFFPTRVSIPANLYGVPLEIESCPYMSQDGRVSACATASLWVRYSALKDGACGWLRQRQPELPKANRHQRHPEACPISNIDRGVKVRMGRIATLFTGEPRLTRSIGLSHMPTLAAPLAGVPRINQHDWYASELCLVLDKVSELVKRPPCHFGALRLPKPRPTADILQVFQGYAAFGAFGCRNERLADTVIDIPTKTGFFLSHSLQRTPNILRPFAIHLRHMRGTLQPLTALRIARATGFNARTAVGSAVRGGCQVDYAQVHTHHVLWLNRRVFRHVDGTQEIEHAIPQHQIGLPLDTPLPRLLVGATQKRHLYPAPNGPQTRAVQTVEAQDPLVVTHGAIGSEDWADGPVTLKALDRFGNGAYRKLRGQAKPFSDLVVGQVVQRHLPVHASGKAFRSSIRRSLVAQPHGLTQGRMLVGSWQQVESQGEFHGENIA